MRFIPLYLLAFLIISCGNSDSGSTSALKPSSTGGEYEITIVVDGALETDEHVKAITKALTANYPMLNQPEQWFKLSWIDIKDFGNITQKQRNLIFLDNTSNYGEIGKTMSKLFSKESIEKLKTNTDKFYLLGRNVWAEPQELMYLAAESPKELAQKISSNEANIRNHFDQKEFERLRARMFKYRERKDFEDELVEKHKYKLRLPEIYEKAKYNKDPDSLNAYFKINSFEWFYTDTKKAFNNVIVYTQSYTDSNQLNIQSIVSLRDSVCKYYVPCGAPNSYMSTEMRYPDLLPKSEVVTLNGYYAIKTIGYWKAVNDFMGGPFIHYTVVDEKNNRIIHLEGNVHAPGTGKKKFIQRLKAILTTIEIK